MTEEITSAVIMDTGSGITKAGFAQYDFPSIYSKTVLARPKNPSDEVEKGKRVFGNEALKEFENGKGETYDLITPIKRGVIQDWDEIEHFWQNLYLSELKTTSTNHPIIVSLYSDEHKYNKERIVQMFFENFNVPGFYSSIHSLFSIYASGKTTGMVVDSGYGLTTVVPIIDGYNRGYAHIMEEIGGYDVDEYLRKRIRQKIGDEVELDSSEIENIKKTRLYLSQNLEKEVEDYTKGARDPVVYDLPDGNKIDLKDEIVNTPEILFNPKIAGINKIGIQEMVMSCLEKIELEKRSELINSIILSGGSTKIDGFVSKINKELSFRLPSYNKVKIFSSNERQYLPWTGAAVVSGLSTFQTMWITQADYDENGPTVIHRKCL